MGRNKIHIKISPTIRNFLQYFADNQETISALYDLYKTTKRKTKEYNFSELNRKSKEVTYSDYGSIGL